MSVFWANNIKNTLAFFIFCLLFGRKWVNLESPTAKKVLSNHLSDRKSYAGLTSKMASSIRGEIPDVEPLKKLSRDHLRHVLESVSNKYLLLSMVHPLIIIIPYIKASLAWKK